MQPIIGVTARPQYVPSSGGEILSYLSTHTYTDSVVHAGGIPLLLLPVAPEHIDSLLDRVDGIVFTGGGDINPRNYGAEPHETLRGVSDERDTFELELMKKAYEHRIPTMAICRGNQILNVTFGGTLIQDLPSHNGANGHDVTGEGAYEAHSEAIIDDGSRIGSVIGSGIHGINSIHHQAVDTLGEGLKVVGHAPDGTIEALEHEDSSWPLLSVQWHPEYLGMREHGDSRDLFAALVESAAKHTTNS